MQCFMCGCIPVSHTCKLCFTICAGRSFFPASEERRTSKSNRNPYSDTSLAVEFYPSLPLMGTGSIKKAGNNCRLFESINWFLCNQCL